MTEQDKIDVAVEAAAAPLRLQLEVLDQRCKMMQRLTNSYMEDRMVIASNLSKMGLYLDPNGSILKR